MLRERWRSIHISLCSSSSVLIPPSVCPHCISQPLPGLTCLPAPSLSPSCFFSCHWAHHPPKGETKAHSGGSHPPRVTCGICKGEAERGVLKIPNPDALLAPQSHVRSPQHTPSHLLGVTLPLHPHNERITHTPHITTYEHKHKQKHTVADLKHPR